MSRLLVAFDHPGVGGVDIEISIISMSEVGPCGTRKALGLARIAHVTPLAAVAHTNPLKDLARTDIQLA